MRVLRVLPRADADIDEAAEYYLTEAGLDIALRFLAAVQGALDFVRENPEAGSPGHYRSEALDGVRRWPVPRFKDYLVFYRIAGDVIDVVRVLHGARDIETMFDSEE